MQLGITQSGYRKIETDETVLKVDKLLQLAQLLEVEISQLLLGCSPACLCSSKAAQPGEPVHKVLNAVPYFSQPEQGLLQQLLESKEAHLSTQQKLLRQYEEEIVMLRLVVAQLSLENLSLNLHKDQAAG